ncbi:MAG: hypothetical protein AAFO07_09110 [Bacteroidota bacterium]
MGKNLKNVDQRVEETLHSIDSIERVPPNPYLMTRLNQRINEMEQVKSRKKNQWAPAWIAVAVVLIFINVYTIIDQSYYNSDSSTVGQDTYSSTYGLDEVVEDYYILTN